MNKLYSILTSILIALIITSCAGNTANNNQAPQSNNTIPYMKSVQPSGNSVIYFKFNEQMQNVSKDTVSIYNEATGVEIKMQNIATNDNITYRVLLQSPLSSNTNYVIKLSKTIIDLHNIPLENLEINFTTTEDMGDFALINTNKNSEIGASINSSVPQSMAISSDSTAYMIYYNKDSDIIQVKSYNSINQESAQLGGNLTGNNTNHIASITLSPNGTPYISYINSNNEIVVAKYEGNTKTWENIGSPIPFYQGATVNSLSLVASNTGEIYLGKRTTETTADIMTFNKSSNSWEPTSAQPFDTPTKGFIYDLAMAADGTLYIAYSNPDTLDSTDGNLANQLSVKKYDLVNHIWNTVGSEAGVTYGDFFSTTNGGFKLAIDPKTNNPYVANKFIKVQDSTVSEGIEINKFDSNSNEWKSMEFNTNQVLNIANLNLSILPNGYIFLGYTDQEDLNEDAQDINILVINNEDQVVFESLEANSSINSMKALVSPVGDVLIFTDIDNYGISLLSFTPPATNAN